jgi:hypothetical protein
LLSCIESGDVAAFRRAASSHSTFEPTGTSGLAMASVGVTYRSCAAEPTER